MKGKTDINRRDGKEFLSAYPVDKYRRLYNKNVYYFIKFLNGKR